ncbi:2-oxoisovalerate dehydrogenase subunit beta [Bacillus altitudinis]|uniref:Branched-chain alpha-keto acid dehydrogenase E1 subunit n=3 Tax=Bacteria TaxID=2 RepID=A0A1K1X7E6_BACAB|nr:MULTISPECIES: alpha-ketoacid dehydrogenase subunit beta [Bacillus]AHL71075.1 pyruvate dehydrogenase [Bacillus pumilus]EIL84336.1 pyruvate dehydrogenase (acetyl-transferring) E1 component beta subunit [Bacillus sp. M 2-6]MBA8917914.1 pyruvate dehydrogenase E1 component beta subunit [Bacillus aerius]MCS3485341.1 pyruvate dehydrogenase E1 component beta subunit [Bacillus sp. JUb11]MDH8709962.1 pyruvate/2-oxoglutarate/acetoin dehydrogenase E1 component [Micromonospora sp. 1209]CVM69626.1 pyruv
MTNTTVREISYLEAVREAMSQEMRKNQDVFILGEDIGVYGGAFGVTRGMIEEFGPERVRNTPISEAAIAGGAVGAALTGMRPILELQFSDFITIAMDQLVNQAAKTRYMFGGKGKVPLVVRTPAGSGTGAAAQHSQSLEAWMAHIPGLKVVQPSTAYDAKGLLKAAMDDDNPVIFYEHKLLYKTIGEVPEEQYSIPLGKADVKRSGKDVTIVATAIMVHKALEAAKELEAEGIDVEIIDPRTLVPLDEETIIESVKKTGKCIVVHEAVKRGGYGGEIASMIAESEAFDYLDAPIKRLGGLAVPIPYNPTLEKAVIPQVPDIIEAAKELVRS